MFLYNVILLFLLPKSKVYWPVTNKNVVEVILSQFSSGLNLKRPCMFHLLFEFHPATIGTAQASLLEDKRLPEAKTSHPAEPILGQPAVT